MQWLARLAQLLMPTRCLVCQQIGPEIVCQTCAARLEAVSPGHCLRCGRRRQTIWASPDCGECHGRSTGFLRARSGLLYNQTARALLSELKYRRRFGAGEAIFSAVRPWLEAGWGGVFDTPELSIDAVVPVPLHRQRVRQRRFNQAEFFARRIGQTLGTPVLPQILERTRATPTQVGLSANQRSQNVKGAFAVRAGAADQLAGRSVVVVDDLMTTGATLAACAAALKKAGCSKVYGLTMFSTFADLAADEPPAAKL